MESDKQDIGKISLTGELALRSALGLICGLMAVVLTTYTFWFLGFSVSRYHWIVFPLGYVLGGLGLEKREWVWHLILSFITVVLIWIWSAGCSYLLELNWDGMLVHKEYVMALEKGWNPVQEPLYQHPMGNSDWEKTLTQLKIQWGGYNVRFGYVYQAVLAKATGSVEASKASNLVFLLLPFWWAFYALSEWKTRIRSRILFVIGIALNPVWILQSISFWEDAQFAGISVSSLLLAMLLGKKGRWQVLLGFALSLILMVGAKRSGLAFAAVLIVMVIIIRFTRNPFSKAALAYVGIGIVGIFGVFLSGQLLGLWKTHGVFPYKLEQILNVNQMSHLFPGDLLEKVPNLASLNGPIQFLATVLSEGTMIPTDVSLKLPFSVSKQEFDLYFHVFTAPWFGGFGPWYGHCLLMLLLTFIFSLVWKNASWWKSSVFPPWILFLILILWVMPPFYPRWIPFLWILPFLILFSILIQEKGEIEVVTSTSSRNLSTRFVNLRPGSAFWISLGKLAMAMLVLNSTGLLFLNIAGHIRASGVVHEQIEFAETYLPKPVKVSFIDFASNRDWLDSSKIDWILVEKGWKTPNCMVLARTNTYIVLEGIDPDKPFVVGGKEWASVEQWTESMNRRIGLRSDWGAWIKKTVIIRRRDKLNPVQ